MKSTTLILNTILLFLLLSCTKENAPRANYKLDVREWGVIQISDNDKPNTGFHSIETEELVKEPVIYFDAEGVDSLKLAVAFSKGRPTLSFPRGRNTSNGLSWNIAFKSTIDSTSTEHATGLPEEDMRAINNVQATPLTSGRTKARSIFYEGLIPFTSRVTVKELSATEIQVLNKHRFTIYDLWITIPLLGKTFHCDSLKRGKTTLSLQKKVDLQSELTNAGLRLDEAEAFLHFWQEPLFIPTIQWCPSSVKREYKRNIFYRLPQKEADKLLPLKFSKRPTSLNRVLYIFNTEKVPLTTLSTDGRETVKNILLINMHKAEEDSPLNKLGRSWFEFVVDSTGKVIHCSKSYSGSLNTELDKEIENSIKEWDFSELKITGDKLRFHYRYK